MEHMQFIEFIECILVIAFIECIQDMECIQDISVIGVMECILFIEVSLLSQYSGVFSIDVPSLFDYSALFCLITIYENNGIWCMGDRGNMSYLKSYKYIDEMKRQEGIKVIDFMDVGFMIGVIVGIAEVIKKTGIDIKWIPLIDLILGIIAGIVYVFPDDPKKAVLSGIIIGLSASGTYSSTKNVIQGCKGKKCLRNNTNEKD
jgi:hypothetical protein